MKKENTRGDTTRAAQSVHAAGNFTEAPQAALLSLRLLGGFSVERGGVPVSAFKYDKLRALLAFLVVERGRSFQRDWLSSLFWPDLDEEAARQNLRRALTNLRQLLGEDKDNSSLLQTTRSTLSIPATAPCWSDVFALSEPLPACGDLPCDAETCRRNTEGVEQRVAFYHGEFLAGFNLPGCPEFDQWCQTKRESLHRQAVSLLERATRCHERGGRYTQALGFATRLTQIEPWSETASAWVMRLHVLTGNTRAAMEEFERCRRLLLEELGVTPGAALLQLADRLRDKNSLSSELPEMAGSSAIVPLSAERRLVTILCCHLTSLDGSATEDSADAIVACQQAIDEHIRSANGYITPTHGGKILAYFGYPRMIESSHVQATGVARWIVTEGAPAHGLAASAVLHSGWIVSHEGSQHPDAVGDTSSVAQLLCMLAKPGETLVSDATFRLIGRHYECTPATDRHMPGLGTPAPLFRVNAPRAQYGAAKPEHFTGREAELKQMLHAWQNARANGKSAVLLRGEPGIGKSALAGAFLSRLVDGNAHIITLQCAQEYVSKPLWPVTRYLLRQTGGVRPSEAAPLHETLAEHLKQHFPEADDGSPMLENLAAWLANAMAEEEGLPEAVVSAQQGRAQAFAAILALIGHITARAPLLIVIDDLQWADPSTLELLRLFLTSPPAGHSMVLMASRGQMPDGLAKLPITPIEIPPLPLADAASLLAALCSNKSGHWVEQMAQAADGIPLYLVETALHWRNQPESAAPAARDTLPSSLANVLTARLDDLGPMRAILQHAAVFGREFPLDWLAASMDISSKELLYLLNGLVEQRYLVQDPQSSRMPTFHFRHTLLRDAAYATLPQRLRKALHGNAASVIIEQESEWASIFPELIASHLQQAGDTRKAIEALLCAVERDIRCGAMEEAIGHLDTAQLWQAALPETERNAMELAVLARRGILLGLLRGYGAAELKSTYDRVIELSVQTPEVSTAFHALFGVWSGSSSWGGYRWSLKLSRQLLKLAESSQNACELSLGHYAMGNVLFSMGNFTAARRHLEKGILAWPQSPQAARHHHGLYHQDGLTNNLCFLAWCMALQGSQQEAILRADQAVEAAAATGMPGVQAMARVFASHTHALLHHPEEAARHAKEALDIAARYGLALWVVAAQVHLGWAEAMTGNAAGLHILEEALKGIRAAMPGVEAIVLHLLAEGALQCGELKIAKHAVESAFQVSEEREDRHLETEFHRLRGQIALREDDSAMARHHFTESIAIARTQGAILFGQRAATDLARIARPTSGKEAVPA